ncbi:MAG: cell division protein FtsQ/DivIB [Omnitrophica bacterium]|nr:cell division protein FtsQ/DivIB [Candidatus Omnitrophota bacterium]
MRKKNPGKKIKKEKNKTAPIKLPVKKFLHFALIFTLITVSYLSLRNSKYFTLTDIKVIDRDAISGLRAEDLLHLYKGRNIFDIDIDAIAFRTKKDYPLTKEVIVRKVLPSSLVVDITSRVPIGKIKANGYFPIDRTGMVLPPGGDTGALPVISGFSMWLKPRVGERLDNRQLKSAFLLIDALKENTLAGPFSVTAVDAANYKNLSFYLKNGIEVKIGENDFPKRLKMLKTTLNNRKLDKNDIRYIDLRFRDVVIGPK